MAELSEESGVAIPTIRYYLREGLLPPGEHTSPNQARYSGTHVRRLKLIRALLDVGGLSVAEVRHVAQALDSQAPTLDVLDLAHTNLITPKGEVDDESRTWALTMLQQAAKQVGWVVEPDDKSTETIIGLLCTLRAIGHGGLLDDLDGYADLAARAARLDLATLRNLTTPESIVESAVVGTVLGDALFSALRKLGQQNESKRLYGSARA
ncbi:MerR family transcriptional regulator [Amycolatopsis sp. NPDC005232]|uniref:MerR family transcriptional regulator n=1 Tax=Amycolatopsis sp. NPDC005232 TaxID=3157027 RepID=UPI0033AB6BB4